MREGFENLVRALGDAAERLARETEATTRDFEPEPFHEIANQPPATPAYAPPPQPEPAPAPAHMRPRSPPAQTVSTAAPS